MKNILLPFAFFFSIVPTLLFAQVTSTTEQVSVSAIMQLTYNNPIIRVRIDNTGAPLSLYALFFSTGSSSDPSNDIETAKVYFTDSSTIFNTAVQFGNSVVAPSSSITVNGTLPLNTGINYFWLAYDTKSTATLCDTLDAVCFTVYVATGTQTPTVTDPAGFAIVGPCSTTDVEIISDNNIYLMYPNPSNNELTIQINATQQFQFILFNSVGEKLIDKILTTQTSTINLSSYSNNIYFYELRNDKKLIKSGKIIKQ